jgi:hypothetical protein
VNGEGQEGQGGVFTGDASEVAFAFPGAIEESGNNLGAASFGTQHPR